MARLRVCLSLDREDFGNPFLIKSNAVLKELVKKDQAQHERERLEYLKNAGSKYLCMSYVIRWP